MKKFYLGMDIGTESVGMACTDERYNLLRAKGTDLWAVRLFDAAKDASERRAKRTARRRLQRRKQRIDLLQGVFASFMQDETFFIRLNNSGFYEEDKDARLKTRFALFADENYTDKEFYQEYPTIFHLRKALMDGADDRVDLRHYYLALHHIVKYRGHFLFEGENMGDLRNIQKLFENYNECVVNLGLDGNLCLSIEKAEEFKTLALSRKGLNDKKREATALFGAACDAQKEVLALLLGAKISFKKLFGEEYAEQYKEQKSFSFKGLTDDAFDALAADVEEDHFDFLRLARDIYNFTVFEKILEGNDNISAAMVAIYEKHQADLRLLKSFVKANYPQDVYYQIFRSTKETSNYANYIGYTQTKNTKKSVAKQRDKQEFYKFLKKTLGTTAGDPKRLEYILSEIDNDNFLPKILNADNGLFPHQINGMELETILRNLEKKYPVFSQKDGDGYSPSEKIQKIFRFKIPYYVGPLNASGENAWIERKDGKTGKITPWNFDEIVDLQKSNEGFIRRMTNKCTYLHGQDVLPKGSMYYQAFDTLNQINKLTVGGVAISVPLKQEIFQNVFLNKRKVTAKAIVEYLRLSGYLSQEEAKSNPIGGFDVQTGLKAHMASYVLFKEKFGALVDERPELFENVILWHTLNTDKGIVEQAIKENYGDIPEIMANIKWLKGLTAFKEFGRLSQKLLCELVGGADPVTGEVYTVLNRLYYTNENFNQLLSDKHYDFGQAIDEENSGLNKDDVTYDDVAELYIPPMVRRGVWQALRMADEYVSAVGKAPNKIFIEVTREDGEKGDQGRTVSRKQQILELYKGLGSDCADLDELLQELNRDDMTDSRLRQERLYLYFLQLGRCAYTGKRIRLDELSSDLYDVDHIVPQSMTKDDSLDNKVLVERVKNAQKTNVYPLPQGFTDQQRFWGVLKAKKLMSDTKYQRLTRVAPLTEDDFRKFLNRQLTQTNQTVKAVAELLKRKYGPAGTVIVYSKAKNVDEFKQKFSIVKCRETNDLHHARDAYLNIVVGNIYDVKFTSKYAYFYTDKEGAQRGYNLDKLYFWKIDGAWEGKEDIARVKGIAAKTSMKVTRFATIDKGKFYKETVFGKHDKSVSYPRKGVAPYNIQDENGCYKYGGYSNVQSAYFVALEYTDRKKRKKIIVGLPVMTEYEVQGDVQKIKEYFENVEGLKDVKILCAKIRKNTLILYNGYKGYIVGASDNRILFSNAVQWFSNAETDKYVKAMFKLLAMAKEGKLTPTEQMKEEFEMYVNRYRDKTLLINSQQNQFYYETFLKQIDLKIYQSISGFQSLKKIMEDQRPVFDNLTVFQQVRCLVNIVDYLRRGNSNGLDLSLLLQSKNACALRVGYDITKVDFAIIHQSPCGLMERVEKI